MHLVKLQALSYVRMISFGGHIGARNTTQLRSVFSQGLKHLGLF